MHQTLESRVPYVGRGNLLNPKIQITLHNNIICLFYLGKEKNSYFKCILLRKYRQIAYLCVFLFNSYMYAISVNLSIFFS